MTRRTVYMTIHAKKGGRRLGVTTLKRVAANITRSLPRGTLDAYRGDYVAGGTRFDLLEPDHVHSFEDPCVQTPVLKVRGDDLTRDRVYRAIPPAFRVGVIANHDRTPRSRP